MRRFFYGSVDIFEIDEFVILCIVSVPIVTNGIQNILCLLNIHEQDNNTLPKGALLVEAWIGYVLMHFKMFNNMAVNRK